MPTFRPTGLVVEPSTYELQKSKIRSHSALVACGCTIALVSLIKSIKLITRPQTWTMPILAFLFGYIIADLVSGVLHWALDNFGKATTPVFGPMIKGFQGHHKWPQKITTKPLAAHIYDAAMVATIVVLPLLPLVLVVGDPTLLAFIGSFSGCAMFSQLFHAWAHTSKSKLPKIVVGLQELGLLVSWSQHAAHHRPPYNRNYCIVSGVWNKVLDENKVFEKLEIVLFFTSGVRPRSWDESSFEDRVA